MIVRVKNKLVLAVGAACTLSVLFPANPGWEAHAGQRGPKIRQAYAEAGLRQVYRATMDVNGEPTVVEVHSANGDLQAVAERFAEVAKEQSARAWFYQDAETGIGFVQEGDSLMRFLFVQLERGQTLLYTMHQAYPVKVEAAEQSLPSDFPVYPGARTEMAIRHRETGTHLVTYMAGATTAVLVEYYQQALKERGWKMLPTTVGERLPGSGVQHTFRKGRKLCFVSCEQIPTTGEVVITVLLKDSIL